MGFFDWVGFLGTGIQSTFAWVGYNRDAFADNVGMRQAQKYQQKNYQISWIAIARDDIRDMMGISVNRINNYMIVATLILSVAAGAVTGVSFNERCPTFIMFAFYLSIGLSLVYLMLAIMFGVKGQNSAFTNTMKLLTYQVRPENPAEYSHNYMKQAQWIERQGLAALFRIPGLLPAYNTDTQGDHMPTVSEGLGLLRNAAKSNGTTFAGVGKPQSKSDEASQPSKSSKRSVNLEDSTPLESLVKRTTHTWYLTKFAQFMRLWQPYDTYSKYSMGLGIICLGQGSAYFALGRLASEDRFLDEWAACVVTFAFVYMVLLVTMENFKVKNHWTRNSVIFLLVAGPCCGAIGAVTQFEGLKQLVIPLCFACHTAFWLFAFVFALREFKGEEGQQDFGGGAGFWGDKSGPVDGMGSGHQPSSPGAHKEEPQAQRIGMPKAGTETGAKEGAKRRAAAGKPLGEPRRLEPTPEADGSPSDHWPTDDEQFDSKANDTNVHIKQTVRYTLLVSALLWLSMFFWAVARWWIDPMKMSMRQAMGSPTAILVGEVAVVWPGPLFRPRGIACAGSSIFVTDGFRIFELPAKGLAKEVPCAVDRPIIDVAAACTPGGLCWPLALVAASSWEARAASEVVDCQRPGVTWPLLQDEWPAERFSVLSASTAVKNVTEHRLITLRGAEMVQFVWSEARRGFAPEWLLGPSEFFMPEVATAVSPDSPAALTEAVDSTRAISAATQDRLLLFRGTQVGRPAIEARDPSTMALQGRWRVPSSIAPISGGCSWDKNTVLVLPAASMSADGDERPRLVKLSLP